MENSSTPFRTPFRPVQDRRRRTCASVGAPGPRLPRRTASRERVRQLLRQLEEARILLAASEVLVSCREEQVRDLEVQVEMLVQELVRSRRLLEKSQDMMLEAMQSMAPRPEKEPEPASANAATPAVRPRELQQSCTRRPSLTLKTFVASDPGGRRGLSN